VKDLEEIWCNAAKALLGFSHHSSIPLRDAIMFDQMHTQFLNASKQAIEAMLKANAIAIGSFEKLAETQMKAFDATASATQDYLSEFKDVRDAEAIRTVLPKGVTLLKENVELGYHTVNEMINISLKSVEQFALLSKDHADTMAPVLDKVVKAAQKAGKVAA